MSRPSRSRFAQLLLHGSWRLVSHVYAYHPEYGAPEEDHREHSIRGVLPLDERTLRLVVEDPRSSAPLSHGSPFYKSGSRIAPVSPVSTGAAGWPRGARP